MTLDGSTIQRGGMARYGLTDMFPGMVMLATHGKETVQVILFPHDSSGQRPIAATEVNCGLSCLRWMAELVGSPITPERWKALLSQYNQPSLSLLEILKAAQEVGITLKGYQISAAELAGLKSPAVINTDRFHFMTLLGFTEKGVQVKDGESESTLTIPMEEFAKRYSGYALLPASAAARLSDMP